MVDFEYYFLGCAMTYEEFLNIPVSVLKDLETILLLKSKYQMDLTSEEQQFHKHLIRLHEELEKSTKLFKQKSQLEELFKL